MHVRIYAPVLTLNNVFRVSVLRMPFLVKLFRGHTLLLPGHLHIPDSRGCSAGSFFLLGVVATYRQVGTDSYK